MNDSDLELLLYRICNKYLIFYYDNQQFFLYHANNKVKYEAQILYNEIINDEKYEDWLRTENIENELFRLGLWQMQTKDIIHNLERSIDRHKMDLYKEYNIPSNQKRNKRHISTKRKQLDKILSVKNDLSSNTLEFYAANLKNEYVICHTLYQNNTLVFEHSNKDSVLFNNLLKTINTHTITIEDFKVLSRSQTWRSYWNSNKTNIFKDSVDQWTDDQRVLVNISKMYDSVYEHPECPDDNIIEDDDALDGWMLVQKEKNKQEKMKAKVDSMNPRLQKADQVFLPAQNQDDVRAIMSMNDANAMALIEADKRAVQEAIAKGQTTVDDANLPSGKRRFQEQVQQFEKRNKK